MANLSDYITEKHLDTLIGLAIDEDLGPNRIDITSELTINETISVTATMTTRSPGIISGLALLERIAKAYDPAIKVSLKATDGDTIQSGDAVAVFSGGGRSVLAMERVALNFVCELAGIATLASQYVEAVAGTKAKVYDTRKTLPGHRGLAKYAVVCGGGHAHRFGLYDAILIKDNHLAHTSLSNLATLLKATQKKLPGAGVPGGVEVEVDTLEQLGQVLTMPVDLVLLDNMAPAQLREAVAMRDELAINIELEASGGITLHTIRAVAETGVDRIAIGALTHSAPALDLGLDII